MRTITHNIMNQVCQKNSIKCKIQFEITYIYIVSFAVESVMDKVFNCLYIII
jgi:hypothetical protein